LNAEFNFDFDPCPLTTGLPEFDGLHSDWGKSNWVNPLFGGGITAWVRKAIEEQEKGKQSVVILPLDRWVRYMFQAKAEMRLIGDHDWIHAETGERRPSSRPSFLFILRPKSSREVPPK
jgi:hypothetical protein